jgi:hypothetical protein
MNLSMTSPYTWYPIMFSQKRDKTADLTELAIKSEIKRGKTSRRPIKKIWCQSISVLTK